MGRKARSVLARMSGVLWVVAGGLVAFRVVTDMGHQETDRYHLASPTVLVIGLAICGIVCAQIKDRRDDGGRAARDAAELVLEAVLATRKQQPADQCLRLVADEANGSELPSRHQSAG